MATMAVKVPAYTRKNGTKVKPHKRVIKVSKTEKANRRREKMGEILYRTNRSKDKNRNEDGLFPAQTKKPRKSKNTPLARKLRRMRMINMDMWHRND